MDTIKDAEINTYMKLYNNNQKNLWFWQRKSNKERNNYKKKVTDFVTKKYNGRHKQLNKSLGKEYQPILPTIPQNSQLIVNNNNPIVPNERLNINNQPLQTIVKNTNGIRTNRTPQNASLRPQNGNRTPQNVSSIPQNGNRTPQNASSRPQNVSSRPQNASSRPQNGNNNQEENNLNLFNLLLNFDKNNNIIIDIINKLWSLVYIYESQIQKGGNNNPYGSISSYNNLTKQQIVEATFKILFKEPPPDNVDYDRDGYKKARKMEINKLKNMREANLKNFKNNRHLENLNIFSNNFERNLEGLNQNGNKRQNGKTKFEVLYNENSNEYKRMTNEYNLQSKQINKNYNNRIKNLQNNEIVYVGGNNNNFELSNEYITIEQIKNILFSEIALQDINTGSWLLDKFLQCLNYIGKGIGAVIVLLLYLIEKLMLFIKSTTIFLYKIYTIHDSKWNKFLSQFTKNLIPIDKGSFGYVYLLDKNMTQLNNNSLKRNLKSLLINPNNKEYFDKIIHNKYSEYLPKNYLENLKLNIPLIIKVLNKKIPKKHYYYNMINEIKYIDVFNNLDQERKYLLYPQLLSHIFLSQTEEWYNFTKIPNIHQSDVIIMPYGGISLTKALLQGILNHNNIIGILKTLRIGIKKLQSRNYCHNDIKPDNILVNLNKTTNNYEATLIDFGMLAEFDRYDNISYRNYTSPDIILLSYLSNGPSTKEQLSAYFPQISRIVGVNVNNAQQKIEAQNIYNNFNKNIDSLLNKSEEEYNYYLDYFLKNNIITKQFNNKNENNRNTVSYLINKIYKYFIFFIIIFQNPNNNTQKNYKLYEIYIKNTNFQYKFKLALYKLIDPNIEYNNNNVKNKDILNNLIEVYSNKYINKFKINNNNNILRGLDIFSLGQIMYILYSTILNSSNEFQNIYKKIAFNLVNPNINDRINYFNNTYDTDITNLENYLR